MNLPAQLPCAGRLYSPSLDNTGFTLIHGYWYQGNRRTTPLTLVALLLLLVFALPLLLQFRKFVVEPRFAPRSQKLFADSPM